MSDVKDALRAAFARAVAHLGATVDAIPVQEVPEDKPGDYGTPVAFVLAKTLKRNPAAIAADVVDAFERVWLQRRSDGKDLAPGKVDVAVGGHLAAGETWVDALREADEELVLPLAPSDV